jgi:hypothetical protein
MLVERSACAWCAGSALAMEGRAVENRLLALIDELRPDDSALTSRLRAMDRDSLIELGADISEASDQVREPDLGPFDPSFAGHWSEDATEELAHWIVAQGSEVWSAACGAGDAHLLRLAAEREREDRDGHATRWNGSTPFLRAIMSGTFLERFGEDDDYNEEVERVLMARTRAAMR